MSDVGQMGAAVAEEIRQCLGQVSGEAVEKAVQMIADAPRIFCAGAGRSGLAVRAFAMRLMHMGMTVHVLGEVTTPGICAGDLLVVGSGSGRTASLVAATGKARELGARVLLFTIDPSSPIAQAADGVVQIPAPSPKASGSGQGQSVQPMGSLFEQTLFVLLDVVVMLVMERESLRSEDMFKQHANLE